MTTPSSHSSHSTSNNNNKNDYNRNSLHDSTLSSPSSSSSSSHPFPPPIPSLPHPPRPSALSKFINSISIFPSILSSSSSSDTSNSSSTSSSSSPSSTSPFPSTPIIPSLHAITFSTSSPSPLSPALAKAVEMENESLILQKTNYHSLSSSFASDMNRHIEREKLLHSDEMTFFSSESSTSSPSSDNSLTVIPHSSPSSFPYESSSLSLSSSMSSLSPSPKSSSSSLPSPSLFDLSEAATDDLLQRSFELFVVLDINNDHHIDLLELQYALNRFAVQINTNEVKLEDTAQIMQCVMKEQRDPPYINFNEFHTIYSALHVLHHLHVSDAAHMKMKQVREALHRAGVHPTQSQLDRLFVMVDQYRTLDKRGPVSYIEFLKLYSYHPYDPTDVFLHSWYHYGRNPIPYNMPVEISPIQDFIAGTVAGISLTLVGHPFDTIKVRMQTQTETASSSLTAPRQFRSGMDCLIQTLKHEGILAVFKGMASPMATIPLVNAIVFAAYGNAKDNLHKKQTEKRPLSLWEISAAGAYAGLINCFIICPVELVKTRLQIQYQPQPIKMPTLPPLYRPPGSMLSSMEMARLAAAPAVSSALHGTTPSAAVSFSATSASAVAAAASSPSSPSGLSPSSTAAPRLTHISAYNAAKTFDGPVDCVKKIVAANGLKGLYRGMSATIYREIPGYGGQFFAYEAMKRALTKEGQKTSDVSGLPLMLAGGVAGIFGWMVSYPMDYVKSQIQAEAYDKKTPYRKHPVLLDGGFFDCWSRTVKAQGHRALWRGFGVCIARAFPANAAGFFTYEWTLKAMQKYDVSHV